MLAELRAALALLTRIPIGRAPVVPLHRAFWALPLVGAALGLFGGVVLLLLHRAGLPPILGACWALAGLLIATGGLHEDGLADCADGLGGHSTTQRLEIMRDSRLGSYGALALLLCLLIRVTAMASLGAPLRMMMAAAALGRGGIVLLAWTVPPARPDGLASELRDLTPITAAIGLSIGVVPLCLLPHALAAISLLLALAICAAIGGLARRKLGGLTGDVLGACSVLIECAALTVMAHG